MLWTPFKGQFSSMEEGGKLTLIFFQRGKGQRLCLCDLLGEMKRRGLVLFILLHRICIYLKGKFRVKKTFIYLLFKLQPKRFVASSRAIFY